MRQIECTVTEIAISPKLPNCTGSSTRHPTQKKKVNFGDSAELHPDSRQDMPISAPEGCKMDFASWKNMLSSSETLERSDAADSLPDDGEFTEIVQLLIGALHDADDLVRASAAETLGCLDSDDVRSALREALRTETDELPRGYVASSLGAMGHLPDLKLLVDEARSSDITAWRKLHCAQGIAILSLDYAIRTIVDIIKDPKLDLGGPAFGHLDIILDALTSGKTTILDIAEQTQGHETSRIEKDNVLTVLSKR